MSESLESQLTELDIPVESDCGTAIRRSDSNENRNFETFKNNIHGRNRKYLSIEAPHRFSASNAQLGRYSLRNSSDIYSEAYSGEAYQCNDQNKRTTSSVIYPDFWNSFTAPQYRDSAEFHKFADGYLLDYNTPLNLLNYNGSLVCDSMAEMREWNKWNFGKLNEMGPCLDVAFSKGSLIDSLSKKDANAYELAPYMALHNMYGYKQAQLVTKSWKDQNINKRPFVMSLSTFLGIGRYAGHLGAPIYSNWTSLKLSLKQTLDFSIFGVAMSGFPVGGFKGEMPKDEVLRRWFQLASVQPFMISYTDFEVEPRTKVKSVREMIRSNIQARYKLLPYFYTLFQRASEDGSLVIAPLFVEFPADVEVYRVNEQFMLGPALLASPVVEGSATVVKAYFPEGRW